MAQTIDGHIAQQNGKWSTTSKEDARRMDLLRKWADCIIFSRRSLVRDNALLYIKSNLSAKNHPRPVIIMQKAEKLPSELHVFSAPHPAGEIWIHDAAEYGKNFSPFDENAKNNKKWTFFYFASVREIIDSLVARGFKKILLEGGGIMNGLFFSEGLVDEVYITLIPEIIGGHADDRIVKTGEYLVKTKFYLKSMHRKKDEVFFRFIRRR